GAPHEGSRIADHGTAERRQTRATFSQDRDPEARDRMIRRVVAKGMRLSGRGEYCSGLVFGRLSTSDQTAKTVDPDRSVGLDRGAEATDGGAGQEHGANVALGIDGRAAVEPLVEIEYE